jgi:hypothetical protein
MSRARRGVKRVVSRASDKRGGTYVTDIELKRAVGRRSILEVCASIRERDLPRLMPGLDDIDRTSQIIARLFPESAEKARREAEAILAHRVVVFDNEYDLGREIDWHRDPVSGLGYPLIHFTRSTIKPNVGADPRRIWELNRLHQFTTLGRAYALTRDERFTDEFLLQLASWYEQNPPRFGINWTVAMEAGIRAVNVIAALDLFRNSPRLSDKALELILKLLISHGRFIWSNLESSHLGSSNHYLGDLIGLVAIGSAVPEISTARRWLRFASREFDREIQRQVLSDGVDYEGAIAYHRLVSEIFLLAAILKKRTNSALSQPYVERLAAMFDFARVYLKPDGTAPAIGDSDDGRLLKFRQRAADDHSYLMSLAAAMFMESRFKVSAEPDEEMLWWFGAEGLTAFENLKAGPAAASELFREGQIAVQRSDDLYMIVDCGDHGLGGIGSHAHSDALSFELYAYGRTFLRDPGTYVYSASEMRRNLFRSTAYHNTVRIDGQEISPIETGRMFSLGKNVRPKVLEWTSSEQSDELEAEHDAYSRLSAPVIHKRGITFDKAYLFWVLTDSFTGEGDHLFEFFFNADAGLEVSVSMNGLGLVASEDSSLAIVPVSRLGFRAQTSTRWVSPSYGTRVRSSGIIYNLLATVPFESVILLIPFRKGEESRSALIIERYERRLAV